MFYFHPAALSDLFAVCSLWQGYMFMAVMNLDQNSDCQAGFSEDTCSVLQLQMQKVSPGESGLESKTSASCFLRETARLLAAAVWHYFCDFSLQVSIPEPCTLQNIS